MGSYWQWNPYFFHAQVLEFLWDAFNWLTDLVADLIYALIRRAVRLLRR